MSILPCFFCLPASIIITVISFVYQDPSHIFNRLKSINQTFFLTGNIDRMQLVGVFFSFDTIIFIRANMYIDLFFESLF